MKKIITICLAIVMTASMFAQSPDKMSYQAVIRNSSNALVSNQAVGIQITILQGSSSGTVVYSETQTPTSNSNGLVSVEIGGGTVVSGTFSTIDWGNGPYFIKTETDPTGGTSYSITGISQLLSVPYALHAKNTDSWKINGDSTFSSNNVGIGTNAPMGKLHIFNSSTYEIRTGANDYEAFILNSLNTGTSPRMGIEFAKNGNSLWRIGNDLFASGINEFSIWDVQNSAKRFVINSNGNIGIGTTSPARTLHINSIMRLEPISSAPSNPSEGDIYMDSITHKLMVYDGTTWQSCW
jgi:hypothetical protein